MTPLCVKIAATPEHRCLAVAQNRRARGAARRKKATRHALVEQPSVSRSDVTWAPYDVGDAREQGPRRAGAHGTTAFEAPSHAFARPLLRLAHSRDPGAQLAAHVAMEHIARAAGPHAEPWSCPRRRRALVCPWPAVRARARKARKLAA